MHEHLVVTTTIPGYEAPAFDAALMTQLSHVLAAKRPRFNKEAQQTVGIMNDQGQLYRLVMCFGKAGISEVTTQMDAAGFRRMELPGGTGLSDVDIVYQGVGVA